MSSTAEASTERAVPRRRPDRTQPLAAYLAQFAAGILAPVLLITGYMLIDAAGRERADAMHDARSLARRISAALDLELQKTIAVGLTLAAAPSLVEGDRTGFDTQARTVAGVVGGTVSARDARGRTILDTAVPPGAPLGAPAPESLPQSDEGVFAIDRAAAAARAPVVSDLLIGTAAGEPMVMVDAPVLRASEAVAFIGVSLFPRRLVEIVRPGLPDGWIAGITGRDGRLIARNRDLERFIGTPNPAFLQHLRAHPEPEGSWNGPSRDGGTPLAGFYVRSALSGWVTSIAVPETLLREPERRAVGLLFGLTAAALAVSLCLGWWFSRRIARPIHRLVSQAEQLGGVRPDTGRDSGARPPASGVKEVQMMTTALRAASDELQSRAVEAERSSQAIRQNEERLQLVQETAGIGTLDWDFETGRAVGSSRFHAMFGLPAGEAFDLDAFLARAHPADRARVARERERRFAEGGALDEEFRVLAPDGQDRWVHGRGRVDLRRGRPARLLAAYTDVTPRKRDEQALAASEARFRGTFDNAAVGVAHAAFDGHLLLVNRRICDILGVGREALLGRTLADITHPDDREADRVQRQELLAGEIASYGVEQRLLRGDGAAVWCGMTMALQRDLAGTPVHLILTMRDIGARRRAQEDLRERLEEIEALYDNTPIGLSLIDRDRRFLRVNRALADMNELPTADHIGRDMWEIVPALRTVIDPLVQRVLDTGLGAETELSGPARAHPEIIRHWREKLYPLRGADGIVKAVGITVEDITESKRTEDHFRFLMRELSHRSKNLLAVIQGMATQTARGVETVEEFRRRFGERLMGLSASHDLLVNRNWLGVSVDNLVTSQLAPFVGADDPRLTVDGPEVDLTSVAAEALGLALHELATNSVKYGALRDAEGRLTIAWEVVPDEAGERRFRMVWTERAAAPITPPVRRGFGRLVIERVVQSSLNGKVTLDFPPEGMVWRIDAPDTCLAPGVPAQAA